MMANEIGTGDATLAPPIAGRRVLLVEDELLVAMLIEPALQQEGWVVLGPLVRLASALEAARSEVIDAAILDMDLAGEDTRPVADALEARGIPFLFLTGYGADGLPPDKPHWRALGKPFRLDALLGTLAAVVAGAPR
jgi:DNA-binding response OmpR family regulator